MSPRGGLTRVVPRYVVKTAQPTRPSRHCHRVAIIETDEKRSPSRIDARLKCVVRIVKVWDGLDNWQALKVTERAHELARILNDPLGNITLRQRPDLCEGLDLGEPS